MAKIKLFLLFLFCGAMLAQAQTDNGMQRMDEFGNAKKRPIIQIPDFGGYQTLKGDFHMHTVFSDGHVWPTVRLQEAWQEGLDVIAISDHIEYTPHSEDIPINHNRAYELVKVMAAENNIIFVKGSEISRKTPPGHFNAIFIGDASGYIEDRPTDKQVISKAAEQHAFIFWNHPGWMVNQIEGSYEWIDFVDELHQENMLHGIEVFNGFSFHKKALDWCIDHDLTVMGSSDVHNLIEHDYNLGDYVHRSMTLIFAKERTAESVREALESGRTVAWSSKYIAGKEEHVRELFDACIETSPHFYSKPVNNSNEGETMTNFFEIKNNSDLYFELKLKSGIGTKEITLFPRTSQVITARLGQKVLEYEVVTAFVHSDKHLIVEIPLK